MKSPGPVFRCSACDAQYAKWTGRCFECGRWGTVGEAAADPDAARSAPTAAPAATRSAKDVSGNLPARVPTGSAEFDRVLGGGLVPGSLILLAGEPGVGKSTLVLRLADRLAGRTLYVCGEESPEQIALRMHRLGVGGERLAFITETEADAIAAAARDAAPALLVVDSIQTVRVSDGGSALGAGGMAEQRAAIATLAAVAKKHGVTTLVIGQVTKDGGVAGPKTLEHLVDVVLTLEGDGARPTRLLRAGKNRFGSSREVGLFDMTADGLVDAAEASAAVLEERAHPVAGTAVAVVREGSRTLLVEVQALTNKSAFGYPVRRATGFDTNRLNVLLAVLERRAGLPLSQHDVYVNVVGGVTIEEPAADLAVALAVASSLSGAPLPEKSGVFGEIGLTGEIRAAPDAAQRVADAKRLGLTAIIGPPRPTIAGLQAVADVRTAMTAIKKAA